MKLRTYFAGLIALFAAAEVLSAAGGPQALDLVRERDGPIDLRSPT